MYFIIYVEIIYCNYETIQMRMYVVCTFNCGDFCVLRLQYVHEINSFSIR